MGEDRFRLPRTPFGGTTELKPSEVEQAYFLRRSVPLFHAVPVLVIDLGDDALLFPRDWFASDADQERMASALRSRLPSS